MTALAADNNAVQIKGKIEDLKLYLVADNVKIYKHAIVVVDTSGYLRPARNTASDVVAGIAYEQCDNTLSGHTAGGKSCRVLSNAHFLLLSASMTQANVLQPIYVTDDQTLTGTAGGNVAGVVTEYVSATSVWVFIPTPIVAGIFGNGLTVVAGNLTMSTAASRLVPGATSFALRNNGNSANNYLVNDAGDGLFRNYQHSSVGLFMGNASETVPADSSNAPAAAAWLGGAIRQVPTAARTLTTDTATNIDTAITGVRTGDFFYTVLHNNSAGVNAITLAAGAGVTFFPAAPGTIAQNKTAILMFVRTGAAAWNCYVLVGA